MNNEISNPKTEMSETSLMNDRDYLTTILGLEKGMVKDYAVSLTEASNAELYNEFYDMFEDTCELAREAYDLMFKKGWYSVETADENKINQKLTTLTEEISQIEIENE